MHRHKSIPIRALRHLYDLVRLAAIGGIALLASTAAADGPEFESPPVHPIEISADGARLLAVHQADDRLLVFSLDGSGTPVLVQEIMVGLEPVTVREHTPDEVWVVNHLSDSISIVDLGAGQVSATLLVGDEPTDVVFAGSPERAFVCISRERVVRVYDPSDLNAAPFDIPMTQVDPLALAVSPDGASVYVAALSSGNETTTVPPTSVEKAGGPPPPDPPMSGDLPTPPRVSLIVQHDGTAWRDEVGGDWSAYVPYRVYDNDVVRIDVASGTIAQNYVGVGTTLFGLAVHPIDGRLYVSNQEAFNLIRFEPKLKSHFAANRVTVVEPGTGTVVPSDLNTHIDYNDPAGNDPERALSLSIPTSITVGTDGHVYVAAFGSAKVGVLDQFGVVQRRIDVGDGPCGVALDEARNRLYVLGRIPGGLDVVDLTDDSVTHLGVGFDPTPQQIHAGRKRFYDGRASSAHGDLSCATCHVYADMDHVAWDLGDPQGEFIVGISGAHAGYHPMKGPMMTQPLKGMVDTDPFHWRGDRPLLTDFNQTFVKLMGRAFELSALEFLEMETFLNAVVYPPNPFRPLDGTLPDPISGPNPTRGEQLFHSGNLVDGGGQCFECHEQPSGAKRLVIPYLLLGENEDQDLVVPHLRNQYEKVGFDRDAAWTLRGYGYTHNGVQDDLQMFFGSRDFTFDTQEQKDDVEAFLLYFDTGTHAAVGAQWTFDGTNEALGRPRVETLETVADLGMIGLVAKGRDLSGQARGWALTAGGWQPDRASEAPVTLDDLIDLAGNDRAITFTAVYAGCETRLGLDRDLDGYYDRDELDLGSDPGDPGSIPDPASVPGIDPSFAEVRFEPLWPNPASRAVRMALELGSASRVSATIYDVSGRAVRNLIHAEAAPGGRHEATWDLRDDEGRAVPAGLYFVRAQVSPEGDTSGVPATRTRRLVVRR
ncbi:MAG: FlgD immunoglobulin-like domain containing protein [Candidatus Eisenbacteria bacterium]